MHVLRLKKCVCIYRNIHIGIYIYIHTPDIYGIYGFICIWYTVENLATPFIWKTVMLEVPAHIYATDLKDKSSLSHSWPWECFTRIWIGEKSVVFKWVQFIKQPVFCFNKYYFVEIWHGLHNKHGAEQ